MALTTFALLTVIPELSTLTIAPVVKLLPVNVTFTVAPGAPELGLMDVSVGALELTLKIAGALVG